MKNKYVANIFFCGLVWPVVLLGFKCNGTWKAFTHIYFVITYHIMSIVPFQSKSKTAFSLTFKALYCF